MTEHPHGTRPRYQQGCGCFPCRVAEATYRATLRARHKAGKPILGATLSAVDTWRKIRQLKSEHLTQAEIARRLGMKHPILQVRRDVCTLRNALKIRRLCRQLLAEPPPTDAFT